MEPADFLSEAKLKSLTEEEQLAYLERLLSAIKASAKADERLALYGHVINFSAWLTPPEDHDRHVRQPLWSTLVEIADQLVPIFEQGLASGQPVPPGAPEALKKLRHMAELKRDLNKL